MKKNFRILFLLVMCVTVLSLGGCAPKAPGGTEAQQEPDAVDTQQEPDTAEADGADAPTEEQSRDFAAELTLDMSSETVKQEVTVKTYVDGDTTHFDVPRELVENGILKARYLAVDTPESTGKIEEYGKAAAQFTREKLSGASSIILESDTDSWNVDSTGGRYLVWVWYRTGDEEPYRNLNVELLQNGLAIASSAANNRYGDTCMAALSQAKSQKLNVFSGEPDPEFFYGDAVELTLKELRCNVEDYVGKKVAFTGIVTKRNGNGVYVEAYDPDADMYNGMSIYYGFNLPGDGLKILSVGNEVRIVGTVSYYEAGDTYQVSGLSYRAMKPDDPDNIQKLSEGHEPAYVLTTPDTLMNGQVTVDVEGESRIYDYAQLALASTVEMKSLRVESIHTTSDEDSSSYGAMTLTCDGEGIPITVRTAVLRDENDELITEEAYLGKTIDVRGIVEQFDGSYQIKVLSVKDITIIE